MSKNSLCWKGGIRTPVLRREWIYSPPPLTTRPPSNFGNRNNFIRNLVRTLKYSTSHTIRELYLVCTLAPNALPACYSTPPLFPFGGISGSRTCDTRIFSPLLYQLSYDTKFSTPDRIRTCDRLLRRQLLYPAELRVHLLLCERDLNPRP